MPSSLDVSSAGRPTQSGWLAGIIASLRENSPPLFMVALYLSAANILGAWVGRADRPLDRAGSNYDGYIAICIAAFTMAFVIWFLRLTLVRKVKVRTGDAWRHTFSEFLSRDRVLLSLPILAVWPIMAVSFSFVKTLIPSINPYYLDPFLHAADRALHFGQDPWTLLQPLFGYPIVTVIIDSLYALWFFVMYFALLLQITSTRDRRLRMQFLFSSMVAWTLIGGLGAILLSSAGPCYFGKVVGSPDPYAPLVSYLRDTVEHTRISLFGFGFMPELIAVRVQDLLWGFHQQGEFGFGRGISAAPSMHVGSTWLVARMLQTYGRRAAIAGWGFFAVILLGSIHLGWHYAVDGYIAILGAWAIWRCVGWLLDRPRVRGFLWPHGLPQAN
jgi:hypothetical protein